VKRLLLGSAAAALVASVSAAAVLAADPTKEQIAFTAAGKAHAKVEVLRRNDVGKGWSGGARKPDLSGDLGCSTYKPKQSDLVRIGAAETTWRRAAFQIDSEAQVLRTPKMVRLDWQRTVSATQVLPCLRQSLQKHLGPNLKLVSLRRVGFPHVTRFADEIRTTVAARTSAGSVPVEIDLVVLGQARNEISLTVSGPAAVKAYLRAAAARMARLLAGRLQP
jgi:hypothetical protein